jgi:hypothetical protein
VYEISRNFISQFNESMAKLFFLLLLVSVANAFDCSFTSTYPRQYVVAELTADEEMPLLGRLDGRLDDAAWRDSVAPFSSPFLDISTATLPPLRTAVKLRWSSQSGTLYIGALLEEPAACGNITATCHCINATQDQVIFHDNDFEVFVDADGSTHMYKEYEINAYNATWILQLDRPYDDGGAENSTRVLGPRGFDMQPPARSAVHVDGGRLSDPRAGPTRQWSVEIALPLARLAENTALDGTLPRAGDMWRINFSRVRWNNAISPDGASYWREPSCTTCPVPGAPHEDNWVWSPQREIAMHLPERWGILQFAGVPVHRESSDASLVVPPSYYAQWPVRSVAMAIYYAEHAFAAAHGGAFAMDAALLAPFVEDRAIIDGTCAHSIVIDSPPQESNELSRTGAALASGFVARIVSIDNVWTASIRDDRLLLVAPVGSAADL